MRNLKLTPTQARILRNVADGVHPCNGRPRGMSAAGGWDRSLASCVRNGWLERNHNVLDRGHVEYSYDLTDAGRAALTQKDSR